MCPAIKTEVPDNQDNLPYQCQWRLAEMDQGVPSLPSACDSFVASLGGLKKEPESKWHFNCLQLDGL